MQITFGGPVISLQNTGLSTAMSVGMACPLEPNVRDVEGISNKRHGSNASVGITESTFAK